MIQSSIAASPDERVVLCGSQGRVVIPHAHFASEALLYNAAGQLVEHFIDTQTRNSFTYEIQEVVQCVREGRVESAVIPLKDTLACAGWFDKLLG